MTQAALSPSLACARQRHGSRSGRPGGAAASKAGRHSGHQHDAGGQCLEDWQAGGLLQQPGGEPRRHGSRCGAHPLDEGRRPANGKAPHKCPDAHNRRPICGQECRALQRSMGTEMAWSHSRQATRKQQRCSRWAVHMWRGARLCWTLVRQRIAGPSPTGVPKCSPRQGQGRQHVPSPVGLKHLRRVGANTSSAYIWKSFRNTHLGPPAPRPGSDGGPSLGLEHLACVVTAGMR